MNGIPTVLPTPLELPFIGKPISAIKVWVLGFQTYNSEVPGRPGVATTTSNWPSLSRSATEVKPSTFWPKVISL